MSSEIASCVSLGVVCTSVYNSSIWTFSLFTSKYLSEAPFLAKGTYVHCITIDHVVCLQLIDWMEARGAYLLPGDHALRLDLVCKVNGLEAAEEYFLSLPDMHKSVKTYSSLLNCYAEHKPEKGLELYEKMRTMNIVPNTLVYKNLMSLYLKAGQPEKVLSTFEEMRESGISANNFTYFTLIESYIRMNDLEAAEKVLEELEKVAPVHWSLYTLMANNYIKLELLARQKLP